MTAVAPSTPICIDSDDEQEVTKGAQLRDEPTCDEIFCQMMVPQQTSNNRGANNHVRMLLFGSVSITLGSYTLDEEILQEICFDFQHVGPVETSSLAEASISIPVMNVNNVQLQDGSTVILRLLRPVHIAALKRLISSSAGCDVLGNVPSMLQEFALVPPENDMRVLLATLRKWLPNAAVDDQLLNLRSLDGQTSLRLGSIELANRDVHFLDDEQCLNDSVLDFFLKLVVEVLAPEELRNELYVASTFFFQKLTSGGVKTGEAGWDNVRRWTQSLSGGLLGQQFVVVPINEQNVHWWLAVVCHPGRAYSMPSSGGNTLKLADTPRIVCLDSAEDPPPKGRTIGFLRGYLWREWCEHHPKNSNQSGEDTEGSNNATEHPPASILKAVAASVPKQDNGYDCGIFIIEYLLHLLQSRPALAGLGLAPHQHWFTQDVVSHRRRRLRWIVGLLQRKACDLNEPDVVKLFKDVKLKAAVANALADQPQGAKRQASPPITAGKKRSLRPANLDESKQGESWISAKGNKGKQLASQTSGPKGSCKGKGKNRVPHIPTTCRTGPKVPHIPMSAPGVAYQGTPRVPRIPVLASSTPVQDDIACEKLSQAQAQIPPSDSSTAGMMDDCAETENITQTKASWDLGSSVWNLLKK